MDAIMLHDPTALLGVLAPELFRWRRGAIRVCHEGVGKGHCIMDGE